MPDAMHAGERATLSDPVRRLGERGTPRPRLDLVDPHRERLAGARTANLDRPCERVPRVELGVP